MSKQHHLLSQIKTQKIGFDQPWNSIKHWSISQFL